MCVNFMTQLCSFHGIIAFDSSTEQNSFFCIALIFFPLISSMAIDVTKITESPIVNSSFPSSSLSNPTNIITINAITQLPLKLTPSIYPY